MDGTVNGEEQAEYDEGQEEVYLRIMIPFAVGLRLLFAIFFCLFCLIDVLSAGRRARSGPMTRNAIR